MARSLERQLGAEADLNIDLQRAIFVLTKPIALDFARMDDIVSRNSFTLGGIHFRARGKIVAAKGGLAFEFETGQRVLISDPAKPGPSVEVVGLVTDWKGAEPRMKIVQLLPR